MSADDTHQSPHVMASAFFSNSFAFWSPGVQNVWVTPDLLQQKSISPGCNTWVHPPENIPVNLVCTHPTVFNSSCLINLQLLWRICFKVPEKLGIHDTTNVWAGVCMLVMCLYWKELFPQVNLSSKKLSIFSGLCISGCSSTEHALPDEEPSETACGDKE